MVDLFGASDRTGVTDDHVESLDFSVKALQGLGVPPEIIERYTSLYNSRPDGKPHIED